MKINLAVSTLGDSLSSMTEHLLSEYMEAAHEFKAWREADKPIFCEALAMELIDIQFMAASIAGIRRVELSPILLINLSESAELARLYRTWTEMSDELIRCWNYLRNVSKEPTKSEERNIKVLCRQLIVAVEYVLNALDLGEDECNRLRSKAYEKNRMRGYYD